MRKVVPELFCESQISDIFHFLDGGSGEAVAIAPRGDGGAAAFAASIFAMPPSMPFAAALGGALSGAPGV
jgi:hypothetical protein